METLRERITRHEGLLLMPYKDHLGYLTIGVGRCLDKRGISEAEADYLLDNDLAECTKQIKKHLPWAASLSQSRQEVLIEMCFQLGIQGLLGFKNTLKSLQNGNIADTVSGMLGSKWAQQTPARAKELAQLMLIG